MRYSVLSTILLAVVLFSTVVLSQNDDHQSDHESGGARFVSTLLNCNNLTLAYFMSYFPCVNVSSEEELKKCDIFAFVAAEMAAERINEDVEILEAVELRLAPISNAYTTSAVMGIDSLMDILRFIRDEKFRQSLWGLVGPLSSSQVEGLIPITSIGNGGIIMVSYNARDPSLNYPMGYQSTFYRTLPSDRVISEAMLQLLSEFEWYRIGVINSQHSPYPQMTENFRGLLDETQGMFTVGVEDSFVDVFQMSSILKELRKRDVNIIVGFLNSTDARSMLCEARNYELTTDDNIWILPAYYNPDWWKLSSQHEDSRCSDVEMLDILSERVIFIDGVKYPTLDLSMTQFYSQLVNKTRQMFPSLRDVDLSRYLQHSRATSAYDAVMLEAKSLDLVVDRGGNLCHDPLRIQTALERCLINCELRRLGSYHTCDITRGSTCLHKERCSLNATFEELRKPHALNMYGQVLVSQFIDGKECPVSLYWPKSQQLVKLSQLTSSPCAEQWIGGPTDDNGSIWNNGECSMDFQWNGTSAPRSKSIPHSFITPYQLAVAIVIMTIGFVFGIVTLTLNIVWRNNRRIKASSPRLNVVLFCGLFLVLPSNAIFKSLVISAMEYNISESNGTLLCQLNLWTGNVGSALIIMALVAKNWRLYRIFYNKKLKTMDHHLSDNSLLLITVLITLPVLLVLVIWTGYSTYKFNRIEHQTEDQAIIVTTCTSPHEEIWHNCLNAYIVLFIVILYLLSFYVAAVPARHHSKQGWATHVMVLLILLPAPFLLAFENVFGEDPLLWLQNWWLGIMWSVFVIPLSFGILFSPQYCAIIEDYVRKEKERERRRQSSELSIQYAKLKRESLMLKEQLKQLEVEINELQATQHISAEHAESQV